MVSGHILSLSSNITRLHKGENSLRVAATMTSQQKRIEAFFVSATNKRNKTSVRLEDGEEGQNVHALSSDVSQNELLQGMRAHANRNGALAKQVVIRAEKMGSVPILSDLLIEESWRSLLGEEMSKKYFTELESFVRSEWTTGKLVFPPKDSIFRALNTCPVDKVRVVILGQDPYHDLGQAQGLCFSVPPGKPLPSSLRNIYKELTTDVRCPPSSNGCLEKWAHQGILLLNAVLTVRAHAPASHAKKGWETFTDSVIKALSGNRNGIIFLLWGRYAQEKGKVIDRSKHTVLTAAHPSGLSASRGFFGCKHFSQCNALLEGQGLLPIDWCID
jgi:uracil-DNA glycosylase